MESDTNELLKFGWKGSSSPAPIGGDSGPKRLSILSALDRVDTHTNPPGANLHPNTSGQAPRKRLSDGVPAGREDAENNFAKMLQQGKKLFL